MEECLWIIPCWTVYITYFLDNTWRIIQLLISYCWRVINHVYMLESKEKNVGRRTC